MVDLSSVTTVLSAISSVSVVAGAVFIVFQLRQNSKLIRASVQENKATMLVALIDKLTNESFARRRKLMYDTVKKYAAVNWTGFDDSLEDFEVRNFAYTYALIGQLVKEGVVDLSTVSNALQFLVVLDWEVFSPVADHMKERFGLKFDPFGNFQWLADETRARMNERSITEEKQRSNSARISN